MAALGIDIGTSAAKVLALSSRGQVLAKASAAYPLQRPHPHWAQQKPAHWMRAAGQACRAVAAQLPAGAITAVGLSGQLNGFVLLDRHGRVLHDAIIWLDLRAQDERVDRRYAKLALERTANPPAPITVLAKLKWLARHRPGLWSKAHRLVMVKDYLHWRLTGQWVTDHSDASATGLYHYAGRCWDKALLRSAGIPARLLPPIVDSTATPGVLVARAAKSLGLRPGIPVVAGAGDVAALAIGCGAVAAGTAAITLGTAGHVVMSSAAAPEPADGRLWRLKHAADGREIWLGLVMSGGLSMSWAKGMLSLDTGGAPSYEALLRLSAEVPAGSDGLTFLPFLEGAATPYQRPDLRGSLHGLTASHGPGHLVSAVMEGVACNICDCVDLFVELGGRIRQLRIGEGGSQSAQWCQVIANFLGRPVTTLAESDASALGAAIIALAGTGSKSVAQLAGACVATTAVYRPDRRAKACEAVLRRYRELVARSLAH